MAEPSQPAEAVEPPTEGVAATVEAKSENSVPFKTLLVPFVPADGYLPTSFGVNLSPKAAQALAGLLAGYAAWGAPANDFNHALNRLLEDLADI